MSEALQEFRSVDKLKKALEWRDSLTGDLLKKVVAEEEGEIFIGSPEHAARMRIAQLIELWRKHGLGLTGEKVST